MTSPLLFGEVAIYTIMHSRTEDSMNAWCGTVLSRACETGVCECATKRCHICAGYTQPAVVVSGLEIGDRISLTIGTDANGLISPHVYDLSTEVLKCGLAASSVCVSFFLHVNLQSLFQAGCCFLLSPCCLVHQPHTEEAVR